MQFIGNKTEVYNSELPASGAYPELTIAEFQDVFHFLSNETELGILHSMKMAQITTNSELNDHLSGNTLAQFSQQQFNDESTAETLYKQAVFSMAANLIINNQISTNATAEASDRQEALQQKANHCLVQYRHAIDMLINAKPAYFFEVI